MKKTTLAPKEKPENHALIEIDHFSRRSGRVIVPLTVREILDKQIARKLA